MKQFNLEEYLKNPSRKVVTRDGRNARIICIDKKGFNPILALVTRHNGIAEDVYAYTKNGELSEGNSTKSSLFFAPEKHEGWINLYKNLEGFIVPSRIYQTKEDAEKRGSTHDCYVATSKIEWEE